MKYHSGESEKVHCYDFTLLSFYQISDFKMTVNMRDNSSLER